MTTAPGSTLDWDALRRHYGSGAVLPALAGTAQVMVTGVDDDAIHFEQRLWRADLTRRHPQIALDMLLAGPRTEPMVFGERLRTYFSAGPDVQPGCSRIPNLATLVLRDLGYFGASAPA